jgi:hypothetical protein
MDLFANAAISKISVAAVEELEARRLRIKNRVACHFVSGRIRNDLLTNFFR